MIVKNVAKCCDGVMSVQKSCCKTCYNCPNCYDLTLDRINDIIYAIEDKISKVSENFICEKSWGFSRPNIKDSSKKVLSLYRNTLLRYKRSILLGDSTCLCDDEAQSIIENSLNLVDISCTFDSNRCDIVVDNSGVSSWLLTNPGCVAFEDWEERMFWVIPKLGITVNEVSDAYKLIYAISVSAVLDPYRIMYNLTVFSKAVNEGCYDVNVDVTKVKCDLDYSLYIKDIEKCKIEFNSIVKSIECNLELSTKVKDVLCKIDFGTYVKLLECNLSSTIIASLLNCGINVTYNAENKCGQLEVNGKAILLDEGFDIDILGEDVDLSLLESLVGKPCYIDTPLDLAEHGYGS